MIERVQKIIAASGYCSRRKAEEFIIDGKVRVNGEKIHIGDKADSSVDTISIGDFILEKEQKVYLAFNKPKGFITTASDMYDRKKVVDLINLKERVFPIGRLDRDASGLLLMTNDGGWANMVMHPKYEVEKTYLVILDEPFNKEDKSSIERGIKLHDGFVKGKVYIRSKKEVEITIHEGKNKIVKRIFNNFGYRVLELCRLKVGKVYLGNLKHGQYRFLNKKEIESFSAPQKEIKKKIFKK
jgi:23S rRNA pseudouridine2605 synthase